VEEEWSRWKIKASASLSCACLCVAHPTRLPGCWFHQTRYPLRLDTHFQLRAGGVASLKSGPSGNDKLTAEVPNKTQTSRSVLLFGRHNYTTHRSTLRREIQVLLYMLHIRKSPLVLIIEKQPRDLQLSTLLPSFSTPTLRPSPDVQDTQCDVDMTAVHSEKARSMRFNSHRCDCLLSRLP
jgi:hypothetical protein